MDEFSDEEVRAWMREHFLRTLSTVNGLDATFTMHGNTTVTGQFTCSSADLQYLLVSPLQTPLGTYKSSLLRSSDVIAVDFGCHPELFVTADPVMSAIIKSDNSQ